MRSRLRRLWPEDTGWYLVACAISGVATAAIFGAYTVLLIWLGA